MENADELARENEALRLRLSRLSEASLRINESLDFEGVLQEVVDSARAITDARFGGLTTVDVSGQLESFLSSGLTPEQHEALYTPEGPAIYDLFLNMKEPLRVDDLTAYVKSLGYPGNSAYLKSFLGDADPASRRARWPVLCRQQRGWRRVHPGGRGDPGDVRLPGGAGHRQRPEAQGGAAG